MLIAATLAPPGLPGQCQPPHDGPVDGGFFRFESAPDSWPDSTPDPVEYPESYVQHFGYDFEPDYEPLKLPEESIPADVPPVLADEIEVTYAEPDGRGTVTVHRSFFEQGEGPFVVSGARGIQYGSGNHQANTYVFEMKSPDVRVDKLLNDNPRVRECLTRVAENPMNPFAHVALHFALSHRDSLYSEGRIESSRMAGMRSGTGVRRILLGMDDGDLVVENSQAVQVGDGGTQHNEFAYQVVNAEFDLGAALASDWMLAWKFATALNNPETEAAQRSFIHDLARAAGRVEGDISELDELHESLAPLMDDVDAVQAGKGNTRRDTAVLNASGLRLLYWEEAAGFEEERQRRDQAEDLERDWQQRKAARPEAPSEDNAFKTENATEPIRSAVETLARAASEVTLSHVAPNREYLTERMTAAMASALLNAQPLEALPAGDRSVPTGGAAAADREADGVLDVRLVALRPLEPGQHGSGPGIAAIQGGTPSPWPPPLGAVAWGAVRTWDAPDASPLSRAQAMLDHLRRQLWAGRLGNTPHMVAQALRAHRSLRAVLFLDPAAGEGLWVDVGPQGRAVAALLIRLDVSAELPGRFTAYIWAK
jgi:hypothetical protein